MTKQQVDALNKFRSQLVEGISSVREDVGTVKEDEIVDDDVCDSAVEGLRGIALAFNMLAEAFALTPIDEPEVLEPSPYQSDEDEDEGEE